MKYDIVLCEMPAEKGLTKALIAEMADMIADDEFYPIEIFAHEVECSAMGFISAEAAEKLDYDYDELSDYIGDILDDLEKETPDCKYEFKGLTIFMSYKGGGF